MNKYWLWFLRGIPFGVANLLPGISGGTVALVLGYYEALLVAVKNLHLRALAPWALGTAGSIFLGSWSLVRLIRMFPQQSRGVMLGFLLASGFLILRRAGQRHIRWKLVLCFFAGFAAAWITAGEGRLSVGADFTYWSAFWVGAAASAAMLIPGISGGSIFILLGRYDAVLQVIADFRVSILSPLALGVAVGILTLAWILDQLLKRYSSVMYWFLAGLVLGSARVVWPQWSPTVALLALAAFILSLRLDALRL